MHCDAVNGELIEFEWNLPRIQTPETFTGRIQFISMFNDISCDGKDNKDECLANAETVKVFARRFDVDNGLVLDQVLKRNGILPRIVHKEPGTMLRKRCCYSSQKVDILLSVPRLHCLGVFSRAKDVENCQYTSLEMETQLIQFIASFFLSISSVSTEQWQKYTIRPEMNSNDFGGFWN